MYNTYTFLIYLIFFTQILNIESFLLDLSKTVNYSNGNIKVAVQKIENIYNHKFEKPVFLKEVYNGEHKLHFESLLTNVHPLVSASVLLDSNEPILLQLNLEKSSVVLLNDDTNLKIQAIFSGKGITNITPKKHFSIDSEVDVDLSKHEDYDVKTNYKLQVTKFSFSGSKLKKFNIVYYNLESLKLKDIKYNKTELKTIDQTKNIETSTSGVSEVTLEIPYKEEVYGVYCYFYDTFPLMIEVLYTFSKRIFYGNTPNKKWHRVYLPNIDDPSYIDYLSDLLDYYTCINGYKFTVDLDLIEQGSTDRYHIENYCVGPQGVETIVNELYVRQVDNKYNENYYGYNHKTRDGRNFLIKHLDLGGKILQFPEIPPITKFVQVFFDKSTQAKPVAVGFFTPDNKAITYKIIDNQWKKYMTAVKLNGIDYRFVVDENPIDLLPEKEEISIITSSTHKLRTIKGDIDDRGKHKVKTLSGYDVWYYSSYDSISTFDGVYDNYTITTKADCAINCVLYYDQIIIDFREYKTKVFVHIVQYKYDYKTDDMYVDLYTNILYTYRFRLNYYDSTYKWKLIHMKPVEVAGNTREKSDQSKILNSYFDKTKDINFEKAKDFDFESDGTIKDYVKSIPDTLTIRISNVNKQVINTIKLNSQLKSDRTKKFTTGYYDVWYYTYYNSENLVDYEGDLNGWMIVKTKENVGLYKINYYTYKIVDFTNKGIYVHRVEYYYDPTTYYMTVYIFTDTLYVYCYKIDYYDRSYVWKFVSKERAIISNPKDPEKLKMYFEKTEKIEDFTEYIKKLQ